MRALGGGAYACDINPAWWVVAGPNGGYLAAILVRALTREVAERPLRSLTVHYMRAPEAGPAEVQVSLDRTGRSVTFASASFEQGGRPFAAAHAVLALDREGFSLEAPAPPAVPDPEQLEPIPDAPEAPPFGRQFDYRPALGAALFSGADEALTGGWLRLREPGPLDAPAVAALCDSWYPAVFATTRGPLAVPTLDLTVHLRAPLPRPHEWALGLYRSTAARDGFLDEDATIWSRDGELLAQSRQLALAL